MIPFVFKIPFIFQVPSIFQKTHNPSFACRLDTWRVSITDKRAKSGLLPIRRKKIKLNENGRLTASNWLETPSIHIGLCQALRLALHRENYRWKQPNNWNRPARLRSVLSFYNYRLCFCLWIRSPQHRIN